MDPHGPNRQNVVIENFVPWYIKIQISWILTAHNVESRCGGNNCNGVSMIVCMSEKIRDSVNDPLQEGVKPLSL
jgi:hypothetical protein